MSRALSNNGFNRTRRARRSTPGVSQAARPVMGDGRSEPSMSVREPLITTSPDRVSGTPVFASVSREHAAAVRELVKSALLAKAVAA